MSENQSSIDRIADILNKVNSYLQKNENAELDIDGIQIKVDNGLKVTVTICLN